MGTLTCSSCSTERSPAAPSSREFVSPVKQGRQPRHGRVFGCLQRGGNLFEVAEMLVGQPLHLVIEASASRRRVCRGRGLQVHGRALRIAIGRHVRSNSQSNFGI